MNNKSVTPEKSLRQCGIVSNLTHFNIDNMLIELKKRKCITEWAYIIHDKDVYSEEDEKEGKGVAGQNKNIHIHLYMKFESPQKAKYISKWFDVNEHRVVELKRKWMTNLMYLTHMNSPDKHQYDPSEVITSGFDYVDSVDVNQINTATSRSVRETEIKNLINDETIREYNIHNYVTHIEYSKYERAITSTFKYVHNRLEEQKKDKNMKVIYINGESGAGKTTYAKKMAEDKNMSYYVSSSSNDVLDSYKGQDCVILDDLRASSLAFPDLLKLLDNHTNSSVKSRFKNKNLVYCKMIIITSTLSIDMFFNGLAENQNEDITQLKRRIEMLFDLRRFDMDVSVYDKIKKDYSYVYKGLDNPTIEYLRIKKEKEEEKTKELVDFFGLDKLKKFEGESNNTRKLFG